MNKPNMRGSILLIKEYSSDMEVISAKAYGFIKGKLVPLCDAEDSASLAQARMLAAAPEMYEALKAVVDDHDTGGEIAESIFLAIAAIARAEGR